MGRNDIGNIARDWKLSPTARFEFSPTSNVDAVFSDKRLPDWLV
jgi:hypothetical protein